MAVKLLTEHYLEFLRLKEATQARLSLHLSNCHIVANHVSRLIYCRLIFERIGGDHLDAAQVCRKAKLHLKRIPEKSQFRTFYSYSLLNQLRPAVNFGIMRCH